MAQSFAGRGAACRTGFWHSCGAMGLACTPYLVSIGTVLAGLFERRHVPVALDPVQYELAASWAEIARNRQRCATLHRYRSGVSHQVISATYGTFHGWPLKKWDKWDKWDRSRRTAVHPLSLDFYQLVSYFRNISRALNINTLEL